MMRKFVLTILIACFSVVSKAQVSVSAGGQETPPKAVIPSPKISPSKYPWLNINEGKVLGPIVRAIRYSPEGGLSERSKEIRNLVNTDKSLLYDALSLAEIASRENDRDATAFFCIFVDAAMAFNRQGSPQQFNYAAEQNCVNTLKKLADQSSSSALFWRSQYWMSGREAGTQDRYVKELVAAADQQHAWAAYLAGWGYIHGNTGFGKDEIKGKRYLEFARAAFTRPAEFELIDKAYASARNNDGDIAARADKEKANFEAAINAQKSLEVMYVCADSANMGHGFLMAKTLGGLLADDRIQQIGGFMNSLPKNVKCSKS